MQRQNVNSRGIGMELARHRRNAGMTLEQVGGRLGMSVSTLSRLENGKREPTSEEVAAILAVLGVTGPDRDDLIDHARGVSRSGMVIGQSNRTWRTYQAFEAEATSITNFELTLVPGLAQTAEYVHALLTAIRVNEQDVEIRATVDQRMARQAILTRKRAPEVNVIMPESALRLPIGGPQVMANQVRHLIDLATRSTMSVKVIPAAVAAHPGLGGQFVILDFADHPSFVFLEAETSGLYLDDPEDVAIYRRRVELLEAAALDTPGSVELMRSISHDLDECRGSGYGHTFRLAQEQL